jgi:diguanylate cyclase (GGDEF)-like protein
MEQANVFIRETKFTKSVPVTDRKKPEISQKILRKWQRIINLTAKIIDVPVALLTYINTDKLVIFMKNNHADNPYPVGSVHTLGKGVYCETVIGENRALLVENAAESDIWKDNPDISSEMLSYYGLPLKWPDGEFFGTISIMNKTADIFNEKFMELLQEFSLSIEADLAMLVYRQNLEHYANIDILTGVYNRRKLDQSLHKEFDRSKRFGNTFSLAIFDINDIKNINASFGHETGDDMLVAIATIFTEKIRTVDTFGRWGNDEFLLLCPNTDSEGIETLIDSIRQAIITKMDSIALNEGFCHGSSEYRESDNSEKDVINRADMILLQCKRSRTASDR